MSCLNHMGKTGCMMVYCWKSQLFPAIQRKLDCESDKLVRTVSRYDPIMQFDDLFCNGKTNPAPPVSLERALSNR